MKKYFLVFAIIFSLITSCKQEKSTTYYLIRHAEKDRTNIENKNPGLKDKGLERAKKWNDYFKEIKLDAVYSTDYNRTQQTAKPTADSKNLIIKSYNPRELYDDVFQKETKGKTVLIVGHSNTTPDFVNKIVGYDTKHKIDDNDNASLFIVSVVGDNKTVKRLKVN